MKKIIFSLILLSITLFSYGQQSVCLNTSTNFLATVGQGSYTWTVEDRITGQVLNGTVATISGATWGVRVSGASSVNITFTSPGNFIVKWVRATKNWFYWTDRDNGSFLRDALLKQPQVEFVGPNTANCTVGFRVTNATFQSGVTYTWSNGNTGQNASYDVLAVPTPTSASVTASTSCPTPSLGAFLPIPPGVTAATVINGSLGDFICADPGTTVVISATNCFGVAGTWNWSASGPISVDPPVNSPDGKQSQVTVTFGSTTSFSDPISLTVNVGITVGSGNAAPKTTFGSLSSFPDCQFLFQAPKNNGDNGAVGVNSLKEAKSLSSLRLYPNPANNLINLDNLADVKSVQIYNLTGQLLLQKAIDKEQTQLQLDVSQLQTGNYLVTLVKNDGRLETKKVQIEK
jgi:Secretion system C-terminal sorting domain